MNVDFHSYKIAAIGPALTDVLFHLDEEHYKKVLMFLKANPGDWKEQKNISDVHELFRIFNNKKSYMELEFKAGSSLLGVLSALPIGLRKESLLITSAGTSREYISRMSFSNFTEATKALSIKHKSYEISGTNAIGMVFTSPKHPNRLLAMYKGVSRDLVISENDVCAEYLLVDAYELNGGNISDSIDRLIKSQKYKTVLCLGNSLILQGALLKNIRTYLKKNLIYCIAGNKDEFECLFGKMDTDNNLSFAFTNYAPYILMTLGEKGMIGSFQGKTYYQQAVKNENIISTSGCGDISLGVFLSGIIQNLPPVQILKDATYYSSAILGRQSNVITEGIENIKLTFNHSTL